MDRLADPVYLFRHITLFIWQTTDSNKLVPNARIELTTEYCSNRQPYDPQAS